MLFSSVNEEPQSVLSIASVSSFYNLNNFNKIELYLTV